MSNRKILLFIFGAVNVLFLPIVFLGGLGILFGLFWHPMKQKLRIALVVVGTGLVLLAALISGLLSGIVA